MPLEGVGKDVLDLGAFKEAGGRVSSRGRRSVGTDKGNAAEQGVDVSRWERIGEVEASDPVGAQGLRNTPNCPLEHLQE